MRQKVSVRSEGAETKFMHMGRGVRQGIACCQPYSIYMETNFGALEGTAGLVIGRFDNCVTENQQYRREVWDSNNYRQVKGDDNFKDLW